MATDSSPPRKRQKSVRIVDAPIASAEAQSIYRRPRLILGPFVRPQHLADYYPAINPFNLYQDQNVYLPCEIPPHHPIRSYFFRDLYLYQGYLPGNTSGYCIALWVWWEEESYMNYFRLWWQYTPLATGRNSCCTIRGINCHRWGCTSLKTPWTMDPSIIFDNCLFERDFHLGADSSGIPWWICQWCHQMLSYHEWETVHLLEHLQGCLGKDHEISTEGRGTFDRQLQAGRVRGGALSSDNGSNSTTHPVYHPTYEAHAMFPRPIQRVKARDPDSWEEVDFYPYEAEHGELFLSVWRKLEGWRLTGVWQPFPRPEVIGYCRRTGMFEVGSDENGRIAWRCKVCRVLILQDWDIHETMTLHNKVCVIIRWCEATEAGCQCPVPKCIMHEEGMSERPASVPADLPDDLQPA